MICLHESYDVVYSELICTSYHEDDYDCIYPIHTYSNVCICDFCGHEFVKEEFETYMEE